jgi:hypothetical protein
MRLWRYGWNGFPLCWGAALWLSAARSERLGVQELAYGF